MDIASIELISNSEQNCASCASIGDALDTTPSPAGFADRLWRSHSRCNILVRVASHVQKSVNRWVSSLLSLLTFVHRDRGKLAGGVDEEHHSESLFSLPVKGMSGDEAAPAELKLAPASSLAPLALRSLAMCILSILWRFCVTSLNATSNSSKRCFKTLVGMRYTHSALERTHVEHDGSPPSHWSLLAYRHSFLPRGTEGITTLDFRFLHPKLQVSGLSSRRCSGLLTLTSPFHFLALGSWQCSSSRRIIVRALVRLGENPSS